MKNSEVTNARSICDPALFKDFPITSVDYVHCDTMNGVKWEAKSMYVDA